MSVLQSQPQLGVFEGLKSYSRVGVELINAFATLFQSGANWRLWIEEGLGALLETPGESVITLQQTNQVEPGEIHKLSFQKTRINMGRDPGNEIVLALPGVGRHHARITNQNGRCFLEDLGSANGTYLNDAKLEPHRPVQLNEGAQFLIFPHQFSFSHRQIWNRHEPIRVACGETRVVAWHEHWSREFGGTRLFSVKVSPSLGAAVLRAPQDLLKALLYRISHVEAQRLLPADTGLFEFLLLSALERANRDLRFPFYFSLVPFEAPPLDETGVFIECVLGLGGTSGVIEIFLPSSLLKAISRAPDDDGELPGVPVCWPVLATLGHSDLSLQELTDLEIGDVLLIASRYRLMLPATAQKRERGWDAVPIQSDPQRLSIQDYFERSDLTMESEAPSSEQSDSQKPDLAALPVRVHIVLSQLEMTLADLNKMRPGSIVELHRDKSESVQLAVNGKIAGAGELVEIEGRLGVRISSWNTQ